MNDSCDRDVVVFTEALKLPASERAAYLERACGGDGELRRKVEALLGGHDEVGDFLECSPRKVSSQARLGASAGEKPGDRVGRYKLLQQIGEGGCGVVFMAEQEEPIRRRVALKIIKPGMDTKSVIARFEAERQALALMDHPSIAKIFDAGATESGRPYFVMELVRGIKITEYCDQHSLTTEERLKLFAQVCQAIQHAHQKGIIHRDIKPSNILVTTTVEGARLPVVIDFGIAKATTNQRLTDNTLFTAFEMLIGTPAYMSPEQAELSSADIDTRTDIYSLGVLLYELLTGSTPFDTGALLKAGLDKIRQVIREREPVRPSTRLSKMTVADVTTVAQQRKSEPPALIHAISGDLDWITMKALEKDRARRYETAYGMALDIERFLADEPVVARPTSAMYRVRKLMRRNKLAFAAGTAIVVMLVLGIVASLWQARRAVAAQREATTTAAAERAARERSESIVRFMIKILQSPDPTRDGSTITVAETLDRAAAGLETDLTNQPDQRINLQKTVAVAFEALGLERRAVPLREKVLLYDTAALGPEHTNTLGDMGALADSYFLANRMDEAIQVQQKVLTLRRKVNGPESADTLVALAELANSYFAASRRDDALKLREEVLALSQKLKGVSEDPATLAAMNKIALSYAAGAQNLFEELDLRNEVLTLGAKGGRESLATPTAANVGWSIVPDLGVSKEAMLRERLRRLSGNGNTTEYSMTGAALDHQADSELAAGHRDEAIKLKEEVCALRQKVNGPQHPDTLMAMDSLANAYFTVGRTNDSIKLQEEVLKRMEEAESPTHPDTLTAMMDLAAAYHVTGHKDQAIKLGEELLKRERTVVDLGHPDSVYRMAMEALATFYAAAGRHEEAHKLRRESLLLSAKHLTRDLDLSLRQDPSSPATANYYFRLGIVDDALGRSNESIAALQEAVRINPSGAKEAAYNLGRMLVERERYAEALPTLLATQKFFPKGDRSREVAERLALAEAMVAGQDPLAPLRQTVAADPTDADEAKRMATVYLWLGQTNEHQAVCRTLLDMALNSKDPTVRDHAAKAYLIQAHPDPEMLPRAVASGRQALALAAPKDSNRDSFLVTAGMAAVREGKPAEAESLLDPVLNARDQNPAFCRLAVAYRTLARAQMGRTEEALTDFADLENALPVLPFPRALPAILLEPDILATSLAHEEARALLNLPPRSSKP